MIVSPPIHDNECHCETVSFPDPLYDAPGSQQSLLGFRTCPGDARHPHRLPWSTTPARIWS